MSKTIDTEWRDYDVIVIGSGGSGSIAARAAAEAGANVLVVSKDPIGCSDTKISEGIATVRQAGADDDSEQVLSENLKMAGADLPLQSITDVFARDSQQAYDQYRAHGLRPSIDTERHAPQALPLPMGGHNRRRSVGHTNSGIAFGHAGWNAVIGHRRIDYLEDAWFLDVITKSESESGQRIGVAVVGGLIYDAARGLLVAVRAPAVVIAAGGLSTLFFPKTDTMRGNTGDSYAVAARAGAELVDMEQVQFLPFCLASPPSYEGLLCGEPSSASFLGVLRDNNGKVILDGVYLRTRAECSAAIMRAVEDGRGSPNGGAYLDLTANVHAPRSGKYFKRYLNTSLPTAFRNARQALGKAAAKCEIPWEVRPGAHYSMGGMRVDANGAAAAGDGEGHSHTTCTDAVAGLFAAGQAMGGLFGANRLGSTSLTELAVFGRRAGQAAADYSHSARSTNTQKNAIEHCFAPQIAAVEQRFGQAGDVAAANLRLELQQQCWRCIGPVRTAERLADMEALLVRLSARLDEVVVPAYTVWNQAFIELEELRNMLATAEAVTCAARERDTSVGGHVRLDGRSASLMSRPYSTLVRYRSHGDNDSGGNWQVQRVTREPTPLRRVFAYKAADGWRKSRAKLLRLLPLGMRDKILEKRYRAIMGDGGAPEIIPGGDDGAIAEAGRG